MFKKKLIGVFSFIIFGFILFFARGSANAATFTVTNTNDSGAGSLRQAIIDANANANSPTVDVIDFDISGTEEHVITQASSFPDITEPVAINGYSQNGSSANSAASPAPFNGTITIAIDGSAAGVTGTFNFTSTTNGSSVRGISAYGSISDGSTNGIITVASDNVTIAGNYIGVTSAGLAQPSVDFNTRNGTAIYADGGADTLTIGGTSPADRNVIASTSNGVGVTSLKGTNILIYGNYFCIGKDGVTDLGCLIGPSTSGGNSTYGGNSSNKTNLFSGSDTVNLLLLPGSTSVVQGNLIGTDHTANANSSISNGTGLALTSGAAGNLIGGANTGEGNTIKGVSGTAVNVNRYVIVNAGPLNLISTNNAILGNLISDISTFNYPGFGTSNLGIDLLIQYDTSDPADFLPDSFDLQGPTPNDVGDSDTGANGLINSPLLKTAIQNGTTLTITYDLDADDAEEPADEYRVEFFANNTASIFGYGPGETYLGSATVSPGTDKTANLTVGADYTNKALSATTTAVDSTVTSTGGFGSTSEFSGNISIGSVTDTDADGISDALEDLAPNSGDGNSDGTPDKNQKTVTSFLDYDSRYWVTFVTEGCNENATVNAVDANTYGKDNGYEYIYGMTDFTLNCSKGDTVNITKYIHDSESDVAKFLPRKYDPNTGLFVSLTGATLSREAIGTSNAIKLLYSITDGGTHDDDGEENGIIVDPVGLASESAVGAGLLANTGIFTALAIPVGFLLIFGATYTYIDYRKHKKPLEEANPDQARTYTYWHHLKVVAIPVARFRAKDLLDESQPTKAKASK